MTDTRARITEFGNAFGWPWVAVKFHRETPEAKPRDMRFCEALKEALSSPVVLTAGSVGCPGAMRSFGWAGESDEGLAKDMAEKQGLPVATAKKMIGGVPKLDCGVVAVEVGTRETPDVLLSYAQAPTAMKIARAIEKGSGEAPRPVLSSVMSACGNAAVRSHLTGELAISFGCDQSREAGDIGRDRLVIGMPWERVSELLGTMQ